MNKTHKALLWLLSYALLYCAGSFRTLGRPWKHGSAV